jgi:hypothetical protein
MPLAPSDGTTQSIIRKGYAMSYFANPIAMSAPFARTMAIAALMGATMLAAPLSAAPSRISHVMWPSRPKFWNTPVHSS